MAQRQIMYIGKKETKTDNVNNVPSRVWRGLGDVVKVGELEAAKLTLPLNVDIWRDVTDLSEADRKALIGAFDEKFRAERRASANLNKQSPRLDLASEEEMIAELERRGKVFGQPQLSDKEPQGAGIVPRPIEATQGERPKTTDAVLAQIAEAIITLDPDNQVHFPGGKPNLDMVCDLLGYRISQSELDHAQNAIKGE